MTSKKAFETMIEKNILPNAIGEWETLKQQFPSECEKVKQALTELDELKKNIARYFELDNQAKQKWGNGIDDVEAHEYAILHIKLSKVKEEK